MFYHTVQVFISWTFSCLFTFVSWEQHTLFLLIKSYLFIKDPFKCYLFGEVSSGQPPSAKWANSPLCFMACTVIAVYIILCYDRLWVWLTKKSSTRGRASLCIWACICKLNSFPCICIEPYFSKDLRQLKGYTTITKSK